MRTAIIGKGTSSIITTLKFLKAGHEVDIFYDSSVPHINVGESTTPGFHKLIFDVLDISIHDLVDAGVFSYKMGINFVNWGSGKNFHHNFYRGDIAHHFETQNFNTYIHTILEERNLVTYREEKVERLDSDAETAYVNERRYDFVVNCSGWLRQADYIDPVFKTVDSVVLFEDQLNYDTTHTLHLATEDGWQFGLPFPKQNKFKCGYLYNSEHISESEVEEKLSDKNIYEKFSWTPRYAKHLFVSPRIAMNGNALFFLEPLQALSLFYCSSFADFLVEYLHNPSGENLLKYNSVYLYEMWTYQLSLALHYKYGSVFDSSFWNETQTNAQQFFGHSPNGCDQVFFQNLNNDLVAKQMKVPVTEFSSVGCFQPQDVSTIHNGMTQ